MELWLWFLVIVVGLGLAFLLYVLVFATVMTTRLLWRTRDGGGHGGKADR